MYQDLESFQCPLTGQRMHNPVMCSDGFSYERAAMEAYSDSGRRESPLSPGKMLSEGANGKIWMVLNVSLKTVIQIVFGDN